jgi:hypothetical protein
MSTETQEREAKAKRPLGAINGLFVCPAISTSF